MKFVNVGAIVLGFMYKHPAASFANAADTIDHHREEVQVSSEGLIINWDGIHHHQEEVQQGPQVRKGKRGLGSKSPKAGKAGKGKGDDESNCTEESTEESQSGKGKGKRGLESKSPKSGKAGKGDCTEGKTVETGGGGGSGVGSLGSAEPSDQPSTSPQPSDSTSPSDQPSESTSPSSSDQPSESTSPSEQPSESTSPSEQPSESTSPSDQPSNQPTKGPTPSPTNQPSAQPSSQPTKGPSAQPSDQPSTSPSDQPSEFPSLSPSVSMLPSNTPSEMPSVTCPDDEYRKQDGTCSTDACDACPTGTSCIVNTDNEKVCLDCSCGFCKSDGTTACCKFNDNNNCASNGGGNSCKYSAFPGFPGNSNVCAGVEITDNANQGGCGCKPSGTAPCDYVATCNKCTNDDIADPLSPGPIKDICYDCQVCIAACTSPATEDECRTACELSCRK